MDARREELRVAAEAGVAMPPVNVPNVREPTQEEREAHEMAQHCPPALWCEQCQMGRGKDGKHELQDAEVPRLPVIGVDLAFLKGSKAKGGEPVAAASAAEQAEGRDEEVVLVIACADTGAARTIPKPDRTADAYTVAATELFIKQLFHSKVLLRSDNEGVLGDLCEKLEKAMPGRVVITPIPKFSSQSNPAESAISIIEPQFRTLRGALEAKLGMSVPPGTPTYKWLQRHAGWCVTCLRVLGSGTTPYQQVFGHPIHQRVVRVRRGGAC